MAALATSAPSRMCMAASLGPASRVSACATLAVRSQSPVSSRAARSALESCAWPRGRMREAAAMPWVPRGTKARRSPASAHGALAAAPKEPAKLGVPAAGRGQSTLSISTGQPVDTAACTVPAPPWQTTREQRSKSHSWGMRCVTTNTRPGSGDSGGSSQPTALTTALTPADTAAAHSPATTCRRSCGEKAEASAEPRPR
mmetsp:Transcript_4110/g.12090  ORF Transcript_4110/g.12090 Transcript_4110/m.12090 type:complete len:200 (-) Transcript_4110:75-674(-)